MFGISTGIKLVLTLCKKVFINLVHKSIVGIRHSSLHLIVHYTFIFKTTFRIVMGLELKTVSFLSKVIVIQVWEESAIRVY